MNKHEYRGNSWTCECSAESEDFCSYCERALEDLQMFEGGGSPHRPGELLSTEEAAEWLKTPSHLVMWTKTLDDEVQPAEWLKT